MGQYWYSRYLETLSQAECATSEVVRLAYLDLADHYQAMHRLYRPCLADKDYRNAA